ncbi:MAG TPA: N-acyl homoserine lactonase family protein [Verrucomicrobiae bacterium]|nr:N-acyl homoserine lactonase family protein [Verrucomicrobiae bacterium]
MTSPRRPVRLSPALVLGILAIVVVGSALAQHHHAQRVKRLRLYVFDCGVIKGLDPALFNLKKEEVATTDLAVPCFLIVHPKGTLMWDVGVIPDSAFKDDGQPVTQGPSTATRTLKSQLQQVGYEPPDITFLAHSHYHGDHIANSNEFATATWLVRPVERDAMFADKPPALVDPKYFDKLKNAKTVLITTDEYDVFGDGKVIIKSAPGHTPGHQVLILHLKKTGNVMLAGDLYHYPEERNSGRTPTFEFDRDQSLASRAMIEDYCKKTNTQLWIEHDFIANSKLKKSPKYYD